MPRDVLAKLLRQLDREAKKPTTHQRLQEQRKALLCVLEHQQQEHARLRNRMTYVQSGLELLDKEHQAHLAQQLQQHLGMHAASLGKQVSMLPDDSPLRPAPGLGQDGTVSVHALPAPGCWDPAWDERVRATTPRDMFQLYKQYTLATAVLLPRAEVSGPGSADYQNLQQLMDKYVAFAQHAISLAPDAWAHRTRYDFETLQPLPPPSREIFQEALSHNGSKATVMQHCELYADKARVLRREYQALCRRHQQLTGHEPDAFGMQGPSLAALQDRLMRGAQAAMHGQTAGRSFARGAESPSGSDASTASQAAVRSPGVRSPGASCDGSEQSASGAAAGEEGSSQRVEQLQLPDVLRLMQGNLWRQGMALKQVLYALWQGQREKNCTDVARFYLLTYPVPLNVIDFLDILVDSPPDPQEEVRHVSGG